MATSVDTELNELAINDVASDDLLQQMANTGQLQENQLYITPDSGGSGGGGSTIIWEVWE